MNIAERFQALLDGKVLKDVEESVLYRVSEGLLQMRCEGGWAGIGGSARLSDYRAEFVVREEPKPALTPEFIAGRDWSAADSVAHSSNFRTLVRYLNHVNDKLEELRRELCL